MSDIEASEPRPKKRAWARKPRKPPRHFSPKTEQDLAQWSEDHPIFYDITYEEYKNAINPHKETAPQFHLAHRRLYPFL